jgi:pimeloyl-ACP methyl ester carboxylesterase
VSVTKRSWLTIVACFIVPVVLVAAPATAAQAHSSQPPRPKPTIVLVHGAWADGSSWSHVAWRLQERGYTVVAPPNPLRGLAPDSAYLADFLHTIRGPVIVAGHSYGGAVITNAAASDPEVKALVYVDAFIPDEGQTIGELANAKPGSCLSGGGNPTNVFNLVPFPGAPEGDADLYLKSEADGPYPGFDACLANDIPAPEGAVLYAAQRPVALNALGERSGPPAWKSIPSYAVIGTEDHAIPPAEQRIMARTAHAAITEVKASHLSLISQPEAVSGVILKAARAAS